MTKEQLKQLEKDLWDAADNLRANSAIRKRAMNGWLFWHYERSPGDWVPIDALRNE